MNFTWVSQHDDVFYKLFNIASDDIETPLALDNMIIYNYTKIPLYKGLYKNEMKVDYMTDEFKNLIDNDINQLSFDLKNVTTLELQGVINLLKIILYKHFNYHIDNINVTYDDYIVLTPMVNIQTMDNVSIEPIYMHQIDLDELKQFININQLIGYKPLLPNELNLTILASDLIWTANLSAFNYINLLNIPSIPIDGVDQKHYQSSLIEFAIDPLTTVISHINNLIKNTFMLDGEYKEEINGIISQFQFKIIPSLLTNKLFLQHSFLDKKWLLLNLNQLPRYVLASHWTFNYPSNLTTMAYLKYSAIKSLIDYSHQLNHPELLDYIDIIQVDSTLNVTIPFIYLDMIDYMTKQIHHYLNTTSFHVEFYDDQPLVQQDDLLTFPLYNQWVVVNDMVDVN
jgi:hypothetical protein